ncbi:nitrous oxide reductase accessory protein NosL [Solibacillus sp. FSL H8-0538]|uniref:nitrous oxide reductase accessory protein NosL n=1 Tax=Solibacillus sp. FSL H8-0538 TaxID=2921400 RepID=UPI0030F9F322
MKKLLFILTACFLVGCSEQTYEPHDIKPETDICKICNMSITHSEFAGQIAFKNGDYDVYDDIGCLMSYIIDNGDAEIGKAFIKDANTNVWMDVYSATYIYSQDYWTPMNYGILAFGDEQAADAYMAEHGEGQKLQYEDLLTFKWGIHVH